MSKSEASSDFIKMQGDAIPEEGKSEVDLLKYELPRWAKTLGYGLIFASILTVSLMIHASYSKNVSAPNLSNLIVILASVGLLLTVPWHKLPITGVKFAGMELAFDVLSERTNELAELSQRVAELEAKSGVRVETEDGEGVATENPETDISKVLRGHHFMNIKSVQSYLKEENLPAAALEQRNLRRVLERMVASKDLEMKLSTRTGNRLYRLMRP